MSNLAIQKVMKIRGYNMETDQMELVLKALKESTFTNGKEMTYVTKDNVKIASFDFGATASISGSSAYIQDDLLAAQLGFDVETLASTTEIRTTEVVTVMSNASESAYTATGTTNAEIKFAYVLDSDGNHSGVVLTQAAVASATEFTYTSGTKTIVTVDIPDGTKLEIAYYPTATTARKVENITTNFTKTLRLEADLIFKDTCTDVLQYGKMVAEKGKIAGEFEWNLTEGGDPAVHNFSAEFLSDCDDNLWRIYFYDKDDLV